MKTTISLFLFLVLSQTVFAQWTLTNGPGTANVNVLQNFNSVIYAGTDFGAYKSTDNGDSWITINNGLPSNPGTYDFAYSNSTLYSATYHSYYNFYSTNSGNNWIQTVGSHGNGWSQCVVATLGYLFTGTDTYVYRTTNNGVNWVTMNQGTDYPSNVWSMVIAGSKVYAATDAGSSDGIYVSFLNGNSWTKIGVVSGSSNSNYINEIKYDNNTLYAATYRGIFSTTNDGSNWANLNLSLSNTEVGALVVKNGNLFISTSTNIYFSSDNGVNWSTITTGLPASPNPLSLVFNTQYLFVGLASGAVYRRDLSTISGFNAITPISTEVPSKYFLSQNYPNPFNPTTNIEFSIPEKSFVKLNVFDINGRQVSQLVNENLSAGTFKYDFNAENLPSGTYFYKLETDKFNETKKLIVLK